MEGRASIEPGLPPSDPTISYWQNPPDVIANHRTSSELPTEIDVVIVGSGITGATIAYNLLGHAPSPSVLMLEARTACSGATGRNGGHTKHASYRSFMDNVKNHGECEAARIARFEYRCLKAVHAFAREHEIQCDSWEGSTVDIFHDKEQWKRAKAAVTEMKRVLGDDDAASDYTFSSADEADKKLLAKSPLELYPTKLVA